MSKQVTHTLKFKLILAFVALIIPLIIIIYINNVYSIRLADQQMDDYTTRILDNYVISLDMEMSNVSEYLLRMCLSDAQNLNVDDRNDRFFYRRDLHEELQKIIGFYDVAEGIFVYQQVYDEFAQYTSPTLDYSEAEQIGIFMKTHLSDVLAVDAETWNVAVINNKNYFVYTLKAENAYIGAWISIDEIISQIKDLQIGTVVAVEFVNEQDIIFTDEKMPNKETEDRANDSLKSYNVDAYLYAGAMNICVRLETVPLYRMLSNFQIVIIVTAITVIILIFVIARLVYQKYIFGPMKDVEHAIASVERGDWDYRIEEKQSTTEFEHINANFNSMAEEIHNLKIDIYEEEIQRQQVELDYLHYQIKPHFILNVINTINSMAQIKEIALIQKMTQYLSGYVRYTFRKDHSMVTIWEELENIKNYLGMQLLRFPDSLECEIDMEQKALDVKIPAMTMMTFVENIIKHAFDMYDCTVITLKALVDDNDIVHIIIKDSGNGFTEEAIAHIMNCSEVSEGGKQVGIVNIKKRLHLIYGDNAHITASNDHGAKIEIVLPALMKDGENQ